MRALLEEGPKEKWADLFANGLAGESDGISARLGYRRYDEVIDGG
jgi:hypothetical protein